MSKKRVYELAKDLGLENKELIARLERIGITGKSHSSALEDGELERIQSELLSKEPKEIVEKRIKSTVIRRRAVPAAVEDVSAEEESAEASTEIAPVEIEKPAETAAPVAAGVQLEPPVAQEPNKQEPVKQTPVRTSIYRHEPLRGVIRRPPVVPANVPRKEELAQKPVAESESRVAQPATAASAETQGEREEKVAAVQPEAAASVSAGAKSPQDAAPRVHHPAAETRKQPFGQRPKPGAPPAKPLQAPSKEPFRKGEGAAAPSPARFGKSGKPAEAIDKLKKKGGAKAPFEVLMSDDAPRKKPFLKKLVDKKGQPIDPDQQERRPKWREEKKPAPVKMKKTLITTPKAIKRRIHVDEAISVGELAKRMGIKASEVINKLIGLGLMLTINQSVDIDTASLIAADFGYQVEASLQGEREEIMQREVDSPEKLRLRAPVVTIMGHVDHGKTSLLDAIRQTNVIDGEAGGITQAIGAYRVNINNRDIVFLDTPGHEAFTAMRARGAQVTDIVVLVVAADDGIMGQTVEAINHAKVAGVPIIVAINKIDKPGADPAKIRQTLTEYNLLSEEWGGETIFCEVSAKKKIGIEGLLEMIILQTDIMELKADPDRPARGVIIEAKLDRGRGPLATVLIQEGTLHEGDAFVSKTEFGRVRALVNDQGKKISEAGPSMPVEVVGFSRVPQVGTEFVCVEDEKKARSIGQYWIRKERERDLSVSSKVTLEQLYQRIKEGAKELNVIVKADVQGSVEALCEALNKLSTSDIKLKIIHSSTGTITENDVMLASASDAIIIGFNVRPDARVAELAEHEGIDIKLYDIIYNAIADIRAAMEGLLEPVYKEVVQGRAEIREVFRVPKIGAIAGSFVLDGKIVRSAGLRLIRDGVVVFEGKIASLRRFKDDAKEVAAGFECGIGIEGFNDMKARDIIETYVKEQIERKL
ncbi:MAG: translation initiation factor IF-2 [Syntrophobacterales bacterium]|nr:translation initiation factor IF-2 [Syntrophobacterales bacterium]